MINDFQHSGASSKSVLDRIIRFCLEQKLVVFLVVVLVIGWGAMVAVWAATGLAYLVFFLPHVTPAEWATIRRGYTWTRQRLRRSGRQ